MRKFLNFRKTAYMSSSSEPLSQTLTWKITPNQRCFILFKYFYFYKCSFCTNSLTQVNITQAFFFLKKYGKQIGLVQVEIFCFSFGLGGAEDKAQDLLLVRQVLYHFFVQRKFRIAIEISSTQCVQREDYHAGVSDSNGSFPNQQVSPLSALPCCSFRLGKKL